MNSLYLSLLIKRFLRYNGSIGFLWLTTILLVSCKTAVAEETLIRMATFNSVPQHYVKDGRLNGYVPSVVRCSLDRLEREYVVEVSDLLDGKLRLRAGAVDALFAIGESFYHNGRGQLSKPIVYEKYYWYASGGQEPVSAEQLVAEQYSVSAIFGSDEWFYLQTEGYRVVRRPRDSNALLEMLTNRQANFVLAESVSFQKAMKKSEFKNWHFSKVFSREVGLGVFFSNNFLAASPGFLPSFNEALTSCLFSRSPVQ